MSAHSQRDTYWKFWIECDAGQKVVYALDADDAERIGNERFGGVWSVWRNNSYEAGR